MAAPRIQVESHNGFRVLHVYGDLNFDTAAEFAECAYQAVRGVSEIVLMNLSGLTAIDVRGARALAALIHTLPAEGQAVVCSCSPDVHLLLDVLGASLNYLPAHYLPTGTSPGSRTGELVNRVREARLHAGVAKIQARDELDKLTDTSIRLASTRERTGLTREQGQRTLIRARAAREQVIRSRQETTSPSASPPRQPT